MAERPCARCGIDIERKHGRKYCKDCAEIVRREKSRESMRRKAERERNGQPRVCAACGAVLEYKNAKKYCRACAFAMYGKNHRKDLTDADLIDVVPIHVPPELPAGKLAEAQARLARQVKLTGTEIDRLAKQYGPPYDSYGKLRAYIDAYDALPPARCLRSTHPNRRDEYATPENRITLSLMGGAPAIGGTPWIETGRVGETDFSLRASSAGGKVEIE